MSAFPSATVHFTNMTAEKSTVEDVTGTASSSDDKGGSPPSTEEPSATPKSTKSTKKISTSRVSFAHMEDDPNDFRPTPKGKKVTRSATVGKADLVRDLCIFMVVMALFIYIAIKYETGKSKTDEDVLTSQGSFQKIRQSLSSALEKHMERNPERRDCDLFLSKSTIPVSGFGIFAGKNYTNGEDIVSRPGPLCVKCLLDRIAYILSLSND